MIYGPYNMTYPHEEPDLDEFGYLVDDLPQSDYMEQDGIKLGGFSDAWSDDAIWHVGNPFKQILNMKLKTRNHSMKSLNGRTWFGMQFFKASRDWNILYEKVLRWYAGFELEYKTKLTYWTQIKIHC